MWRVSSFKLCECLLDTTRVRKKRLGEQSKAHIGGEEEEARGANEMLVEEEEIEREASTCTQSG